MFEAFGNHAESQGLNSRDSFIAVGTVAHDAGQRWHFGQPPAVILALKLDRKGHLGTVTSGHAVQQAAALDGGRGSIRASCKDGTWPPQVSRDR